jgi:SAM-dependent methyltransferase
MDRQTLKAYEQHAADFADDWHAQPPPVDLQTVVRQYFQPGPTADIGCGSGRDTAWLCAQGFPTVGIDPCEALLAEARRRYPQLRLQSGALPKLDGVADNSFTNVLCETVIMHLDAVLIGPAVARLLAILQPRGTLYLSWRVTTGSDQRDPHGRLYSAFNPALVLDVLSTATIVYDVETISASSGKQIRRIIARKQRD